MRRPFITLTAALLLSVLGLAAAADRDRTALTARRAAGPDWVPFAIDRRDTRPPVWDFSRYLDAPAGKYGFLRVDGPHFRAGDRRIRLWGANLSGPACFPDRAEAAEVAAFLQRWGFNAVRLSHIDATWANGLIDYRDKTALTFDADRFDRFFFFLAELKKRGIYYVIDGRHDFEFRTAAFSFLDPHWRRGGSSFLLTFAATLREHHHRYLRQLFTTRNPYTALSLADDPALAGVQMLNETFLGKSAARVKRVDDLPAPLREEFRSRWREWRRAAGGETDYDTAGTVERRRFFSRLERDYFRTERAFYRRELNVKCPLAATSCYVGAFTLPSAVEGDYTEGHAYYSHPRSEKVTFDGRTLNLTRLEDQPAYVGGNDLKWLPFLLHQRVGCQPYVVGEWNNCLPERFDGPLTMAALGDIQDFDGMFLFNLAQSNWSAAADRNIGPFVSLENPSVMINMIPAALAWHGRMIPAAREQLAVTVSDAALFGEVPAPTARNAAPARVMDAEGQEVKTGSESYRTTVLAENLWSFRLFNCPQVPGIRMPSAPVIALSCTADSRREIPEPRRADADRRSPRRQQRDTVTITTPQWVAVWGRLGGKTSAAGPLTVTAAAEQDFSVTATALDGRPLTASRRVLIAVAPVSAPAALELLEKRDIQTGKVLARWQLNKTEKNPVAQPVRAEIGFAGAGWTCYRVGTTGVKEGKNAAGSGSGIRWKLQPDRPAYFYLLER